MGRKIFHSLWLLLLYLMGLNDVAIARGQEFQAAERQGMVTRQLKARDITDPRVLAAMGTVPRHRFVPGYLTPLAYSDQPLPIGSGQTISQPYIVALMSQWAEVKPGDKVLEVGTGSGYQAAVLAELTDRVFSIELLPELAESAKNRLRDLGYERIQLRCGDGYQGWPEEAPFDAILVTATAPEVPQALKEQLKEGGRLVIPVGTPGFVQQLLRLRKVKGELKEEERLPVLFVPLVKPGKEKRSRPPWNPWSQLPFIE
jgi:protein-L-isoaspartate(D-aspartate) O-methyltransferase